MTNPTKAAEAEKPRDPCLDPQPGDVVIARVWSQAADAMRERAACVAEFWADDSVPRRIRALPLHEPADPRDALIGMDVSDAAIADATIARMSAELEEARKALAPFAPISDLPYQDDKPVVLKFYDRANCETIVPFGVWGNFRRARAVLAKLSKGE